jgi:hypothetical protein
MPASPVRSSLGRASTPLPPCRGLTDTPQTHRCDHLADLPEPDRDPVQNDQVILFIAARPRIFALFDRPQPFQKLALSPFLQNGPQDRP